MTMLIDPPTPYQPTSDWEKFLASMLRAQREDPEDETVQWELEKARKELASRARNAA